MCSPSVAENHSLCVCVCVCVCVTVCVCVLVVVAPGPRSHYVHGDAQLADIYMRSLTVRPLHDTLRPVPWFADGKYRVGEVLCETDWIPPYHVDGAPKAGCTR